MAPFNFQGNIVDIFTKEIFYGEVTIENGKIKTIQAKSKTQNLKSNFILPGFIDSHVHIESSMLVPSEFAKLASRARKNSPLDTRAIARKVSRL